MPFSDEKNQRKKNLDVRKSPGHGQWLVWSIAALLADTCAPLPTCGRGLCKQSGGGLGSPLPPAKRDPESPSRLLLLGLNLQEGWGCKGVLKFKLSVSQAMNGLSCEGTALCFLFELYIHRETHAFVPHWSLLKYPMHPGVCHFASMFQIMQCASNVHTEGLAQSEATRASLGVCLKCVQFLFETEKAGSRLLTFSHLFLSWK